MLKNYSGNQIKIKEKKMKKNYNNVCGKYQTFLSKNNNNNKHENGLIKTPTTKFKNKINPKQTPFNINIKFPKKLKNIYLYDFEKKSRNYKENYIVYINKTNLVEKIEINKSTLSQFNLNEKYLPKKLKRNNTMMNNRHKIIHLEFNNLIKKSDDKNSENLNSFLERNEISNLNKFKNELKIIFNRHDEINKNIYINIEKMYNLLCGKEQNNNNILTNELKNILNKINLYLMNIVKNKENEYNLILSQKDQDLFKLKQQLNNLKNNLKTKNAIINELITQINILS